MMLMFKCNYMKFHLNINITSAPVCTQWKYRARILEASQGVESEALKFLQWKQVLLCTALWRCMEAQPLWQTLLGFLSMQASRQGSSLNCWPHGKACRLSRDPPDPGFILKTDTCSTQAKPLSVLCLAHRMLYKPITQSTNMFTICSVAVELGLCPVSV